MKKFLTIITVAFVFMLAALPAFAAETNTECQHTHTFETNTDVAECPDCGEEVYECQECGKVFCVSMQRCPVCRTKRAPITQEEQFDDFIHNKKMHIAECALGIFGAIVGIAFVFSQAKALEEPPLLILFGWPFVGIFVFAIIEIVKTYQIIAPFI